MAVPPPPTRASLQLVHTATNFGRYSPLVGLDTKYHITSPKYLSGNSQKKFKYPKSFSNISTNPLNISYFCFKNKPILNPLGHNFPKLKVCQRLSTQEVWKLSNFRNNMDVKLIVPSIRHFDKWLLVIWNTLFKWETTELVKQNSEEKLENSQKAIHFSKYPKNIFQIS